MTEQDAVPPGYKRTEVGVIPEGWEISDLGTCAEIIMGQSPPGSSYNRSGFGSPLINGPTEFTNIFPIKIQWTTKPVKFCRSGDLLICVRGSSTGRTNYADDKFSIGRGVAAIRAIGSNQQHYLNYQIISCVSNILTSATGSTFPSIDCSSLRKILFPLPLPPEQHAIAAALSDADGLIGALDALIAKKRDMKQAAMQQLLTGRTRLPGFEGEWEEKRLGEVASVRNQKVLPSNVDQDTMCLELEHIGQGDGRLLDFGMASDSTSTKYHFYNGDVLFGRLRSYLRKFWHADRDGICTTEIWPLMSDGSRFNSGFLYAVVQSDRFVEAASISYGTHMPRADWGVMKNLEICLPPLPEQTAIATVLSEMDAEIAALERRRDKAKEIKQGMMQQLLTGKVRMPIIGHEVANA